MPYLTAAVVLVGVVAMAALLLVLALARRISEHGAPAGSQSGELPAAFEALAGSKPGYFRAETVSGGLVSLDRLAGEPALIGFFLAGCTPCNRQLPAFTELAKTMGGPSQVVAVVTGPPDEAAEYTARLAAVAAVVRESPRADEGTVTHAFAVSSWPSYYLLDPAGTIESGAPSLSALTVSAAPAAAGKPR